MLPHQRQTVRKGRLGFVIPCSCPPGDRYILVQLQCQQGDDREQGQQNGVVRAIAWSDLGRCGSKSKWTGASSNVTSTDQRLTTHAKICSGMAWRSV